MANRIIIQTNQAKFTTKIFFLGDNENYNSNLLCLDSKSFDRRDKEKI
jgi:hypothetical protein